MTEKLLIVVSVTTLAILSPGPDMALVMRNTLTGNRWRGSLTALGVLSGNLVHIAYCTLGIALLLSKSPAAYAVLRIASASYLVYLGIHALRLVADGNDAVPSARQENPYQQGFINNVLNPKGSLFYLALDLPMIRFGLARWHLAINRVFGLVLIAIGASVAIVK